QTWTLWITSNDLPKADDASWGFWRRVIAIRFPNVFPKTDNFDAELEKELPGILRWIVRGAVAWSREGLGDRPESVVAATAEYREEVDPLEPVIEPGVIIATGDPSDRTPFSELWAAYTMWADATRARKRLNEDQFAKALRGRFQPCKIGPRGQQ